MHCPDGFNNNTIIILSRHVQNGYLSFEEKFNSLKNIKKIFIDELGMKVATKLHPNEKKEKTFSNSKDKIYENVFGLKNYGSTWVYSDLHIFALCNEKKLAISLNTGVIFDLIPMGVPCIEYLELLKTYEDQKGYKVNLTQYVKYKFVEGITNFSDLVNYVEKWSENPYQASTHSTDVYAKHFPVLNNSSEIIANKILIESKIT